MMKRTLALLLLALFAAPAASETTLSIVVQKRGADVRAGVATLVAEEWVLTSARLTDAGSGYVVSTGAGAQLMGSLVAQDENADLALLSVKGLAGIPATVAESASEAGRRVHLLMPSGERREGMMHSPEERDGDLLYRFTAIAEEGEDGAPLMNNCDQLMAVSQAPRRRGRRNDALFGTSGDLSTLTAFLTAQSVPFAVAADPCPSMEDQLAAAKEEQDRLESEKEEIEQQATEAEEQNEERLAEIKAENEERLAEIEAEKKRLDEELDEMQGQVDEKDGLKEQQEELEKRAEAERIKAIEAEEQRLRERRMMIVGGSIVAAILVALGIVVLSRARTRKRTLAESDKQLSAARSALVRTTATFPDLVLDGRGSNDEEVRIKINGNALVRAEDGQLIGRSAANADYVLNDESVSRRHARLRVEGDTLTIEDAGSLNGTRLNGVDLAQGQPQPVAEGATLALGDITLVAHYLPGEPPT